ncbi:RHS repeat-associated core domain-containing protein [Enterobacter roggenkampii]|uniref:RHS repeat-associated core domain-containing protein n=1 Tax=Enterobacter roggenkampii TaxID=1812935 RepID=UPI002DB85F97|nr:RHS repeat domain-containing protein [Enterobacter roggenkampii]MEB5890017.1 RHS repeat protein [Enterobacter roggenkampii]
MNVSFHTPDVVIHDARGLTVRVIQHHRHPQSPDVTSTRITRHNYDVRGFLIKSIDPRLYNLMQSDPTIKPNVVYHLSFAGSALRTDSVDTGSLVALADAAGRPALAVSATGTVRLWQYEGAALPGRLLAITEQLSGGTAHIMERFVYAGNTPADQNLNLAGQCTRHYDTVGRTQLISRSLVGAVLSQSRQLLPDDYDTNWSGANENAWSAPLTGAVYETRHTTDSTGAVLTTTDASGNVQKMAYDVTGQLKRSWLLLRGGTEQIIIKSLTWSASGQKLREEHGNGVVTTYTYEATTQRLTGMKTERPSAHPAGAKVLQDLRYEYDPVGNVLKVKNDAEATRFWHNQQIVPENTYTYDSLNQLVSATGREMTGIAQQNRIPPSARQALITEPTAFTAWTRNYEYDAGGNLSRIRHRTPATNSGYTTDMTISNRSNRGVLSTTTADAAAVDSLFTAGGHQKFLLPGQNMNWTPRGELSGVTLVARQGDISDTETYRYDSTSQRMLKISTQKTGTSTQKQRTVYLPGLELRTTASGGTETENLQVVIVGTAGRASVRVLHWEKGKPEIIGSNDQVRYSYGDLIQSAGLEVDGSGLLVSQEEYYPYGGTAVCAARNAVEAVYKIIRYSGKERDATGLYYYGYRYYQPWAGRWLNADPAGTIDGLNLYRMVRNNPVTLHDPDGLNPDEGIDWDKEAVTDYFSALNTLKGHLKTLDRSLAAMDDKANIVDNAFLIGTKAAVKTGAATIGGIAGATVGSLAGAAAGSVVAGPVGTIVGGAVGAGIGVVSGKVIDYVGDKVADKLGIVSPYPKTSRMLHDLNHAHENVFLKKLKWAFRNTNAVNSVVANSGTAKIVEEVVGAGIKLPIAEIADLATHTYKAAKGLRAEKAEFINDMLNHYQNFFDKAHSDAVKFMLENYGNDGMLLAGSLNKIKRSRISVDNLARAKNKVDIRMKSIRQRIGELTKPVS